MVKKDTRKNYTHTAMAIEILMVMKQGHYTHEVIRACLDISKEKLQYHLKKMVEQGLISKYVRGVYDITESGKKIHATYVESNGKKMVRLENMRFKFEIFEGTKKLFEYLKNPKKSNMKGFVQYHGKIQNLSACIRISEKYHSLEITCEKQIGKNSYELYYQARKQVEDILIGIINDTEIKLSIATPSMKPDWAVPHLIAETILNTTESSQIRTSYGVVNKSKGRNADWEVDNIIQAEKIMNMPNEIELIKNNLEKVLQLLPQIIMNTGYSMYI